LYFKEGNMDEGEKKSEKNRIAKRKKKK